MRAFALFPLIAAALLLLLTGCSGSGAERATHHQHARPLTERQLQARLLTLGDLPSGFVKSRDASDDDTGDVHAGSPACERIVGGDGDDATAQAEAFYENSDRVLMLQESLFSDEADSVGRDFAAMRRALDGCRRIRIAEAGFRASMTLRRESFADLGDETLAYAVRGRLIAAGITLPTSGHLVGVRVGNAGAVLFTFGLGRRGSRDIEAVTRRAVRRLTSGPTATD